MSRKVPPCKSVHQATRLGRVEDLKQLIAEGCPVDVKDNRGWRPVHQAAANNDSTCLEILLNHKDTDVSWASHEGFSPLHLAANAGHAQATDLLLRHGADPNLQDSFESTPIIQAVSSGTVKVVRLLIDAGANVNCRQYAGLTPLHLAAGQGNAELVELFLEVGAHVTVFSDCHISPVFEAAQRGHADCLRLLLEHAAKNGEGDIVREAANDGGTPIFLAAQEGHEECLRILLQYGACANALTDLPVALPLHAAIQFERIECIRLLLPHTDPAYFPLCLHSPFDLATNQETTACLQALLEGGLDVNYAHPFPDDDRFVPRGLVPCAHHVTFSQQFPPLVSMHVFRNPTVHVPLLLGAGARVDAPADGVPPLLAALNAGDIDLARLLVSRGAPVDEYHPNLVANLSLIAAFPLHRSVRLMLELGADPSLNFTTVPPDDWLRLCRRQGRSSAAAHAAAAGVGEGGAGEGAGGGLHRHSDGDPPDGDDDGGGGEGEGAGGVGRAAGGACGAGGSPDREEGSASDSDEDLDEDFPFDPQTYLSVLGTWQPYLTGLRLYSLIAQQVYFAASVRLDPSLRNVLTEQLWERLRSIAGCPRSLSHLCRLAVRKAIGSRRLASGDSIQSLPLPRVLLDYLLFTDAECHFIPIDDLGSSQG